MTLNIESSPLLKAVYDQGVADFDAKAMWLRIIRKAADHSKWSRKEDIVAKLETMSDSEVEAFVEGIIGHRDQVIFLDEWITAHLA
ncbi:hypothetical protein O9X98_04320 [Agrobacterium salinitolerans]|nr:hypothetical protein [Agrobacterium salinitolerans]